jgi:hypothetical protein
MRKIDKTLKEVRRWKRKISDKTRGMSTKEVVAYFNSAPPARRQETQGRLSPPHVPVGLLTPAVTPTTAATA